jgi:hypothetical protein
MTTYIGFSTVMAQNRTDYNIETGFFKGVNPLKPLTPATKKFRLTDNALIVQDLINAFNIHHGSIAGKPWYGTKIWGYVFEPNDATSQVLLEEEIKRVINQDLRLILNSIEITTVENGVLIEVQIAFTPSNQVENLRILFDQSTNQAFLSS